VWIINVDSRRDSLPGHATAQCSAGETLLDIDNGSSRLIQTSIQTDQCHASLTTVSTVHGGIW